MAKGCDTAAYLTDSRVDALVGKGYSFVGRYIDYLKGAHNDLTEKEVGLICNAGLEIVSLYQPKWDEFEYPLFCLTREKRCN